MKRKISSSSSSKILEENLLACGVCFENFTTSGDCAPRILDCGHTFCTKCLNKIFRRQGNLQCPSCRVETKLSRRAGGPESLPINFPVAQLSEFKEASKPSREEILQNACVLLNQVGSQKAQSFCVNCDEDTLQAAIWGCVECSVVFCNDCNTSHLKQNMFKHHTTISIQDYFCLISSKCSRHPNFLIEHACEDCGTIACEIGLALHHSGHRVTSVEEGAERECVKASNLAEDMEKKVKSIESRLERLGEKAASGTQVASDLHSKVDSEVSRLITILRDRSAAAHTQIDELTANVSFRVDTVKECLEGRLVRARSCLEAAQRVPMGASAVVKCALSQEAQMAIGSIVEGRVVGDLCCVGAAGASRCDAAFAEGAGRGIVGFEQTSRSHSVLETRLSIDDAMTSRVEGLLGALFSVEEIPVVGQACVHPLSRRGGGTIGSEENLNAPMGFALRSASSESGLPSLLFVADYGLDRIQVFDANSGELLRSIGNGHGNGNRDGKLDGPRDVLLQWTSTGSWHLFVSDNGNSRVQVFDADTGAHVQSLGEGHLTPPEGIALLEPIAGSAEPVLLFVVCKDEHTVKVLNADSGEVVRTIGSVEPGPGQLIDPIALALRIPEGSRTQSLLYVSDSDGCCIQVFDTSTGAHVATVGEGEGRDAGQLSYPKGIALREPLPGSGEPCLLYVVEFGNRRVQVFDADSGTHVRMIGDDGGDVEYGQIEDPLGIVVHPGADGSNLLFISRTGDDDAHVQVIVV